MRVRINWELLAKVLEAKTTWFNLNIIPRKRYLSIMKTVYPT